MFTVVEQKQHAAVADEPAQCVHRGATRLVGQTEGARDGNRHDNGIGDG
jgi:hypothetical protein